MREVRPTLPVIILTARGDEADHVKGLHLGADDYVVKPFSIKELVARIRAVLRRSPGRPLDLACVRFPETGMEADLFRRELRFAGGERAELSEKEVELLRYLAANPDRAISREELLRCVWRIDPQGAVLRTVDMHVARLREKMRDDAEQPRLLLTVRERLHACIKRGGRGEQAMKRTLLTWTIFAAALVLVLGVMSFFTVRMLQFERAVTVADTRGSGGNVRLALWRMDSAAAVSAGAQAGSSCWGTCEASIYRKTIRNSDSTRRSRTR